MNNRNDNLCKPTQYLGLQNIYKIISTHPLTVLTIGVIVSLEQRKRKFYTY